MGQEWITLAHFGKAIEAHMVKGLLESEGIQCSVTDEQMGNLLGEVELRIRPEDLEKSRAILKKHHPHLKLVK